MNFKSKPVLLSCLLALTVGSSGAIAKDQTVTLMQLQDVHGHIAPHAEIFPDERKDPNSGGMAKLATLIKQVREDNPNSLLLALGDTTHGSAEMTFTLGDAIMPMLNSLNIDAFLPGNWDFGWGPRVYRQRFTPANIQLAPNNRTTIAWMDGKPGHEGQTCNTPGGLNATTYAQCHVTRANFPTIAINLYNYNEVSRTITGPTHPGYIIKDAGGTRVGIIGITSDVVPQQAQAFNTGFKFTMGYKELPQAIASARAEGAELIVVLSELGLAKNVQLVKEFPGINVMFSGHTHERTPNAIVINRKDENGDNIGLVTEAGEDAFLGRLDVKVRSGRITQWNWELMEADSSVAEDPAMKALVDRERDTFVGANATCHTFGVNAFPFGTGHTLCDPLDTVVGSTGPTIERFHVLEDISNNAMVDAFLDLAQFVDPSLNDGNSLSTTNGFRFDVTILGLDDGFSGDITVGDLYTYYPIGAAVALADFTGGRLMDHWEGILSNVFDPNPYRQRGGWFLGFPHNMHFDIQLSDDFPRTISDGKRIDYVTIDDGSGPKKFDRSKRYTLASCYPHGNPVDEVCRTSGATNVRFIQGTQEASGPTDMFGNRQLNINGPYSVSAPVNSENIFDPVRFANGGPLFLRVAPFNFVHPVDALRRYLASNSITTAQHGLGRVTALTGVPVSEHGGPGIVQPTQGAGPAWLKREFVINTDD
ncbi:MAG: metallophosphoesterase [Gammaproteobacteria bacterium]|nr:metallophosphoesterase [Gammaproteobacteria bacterium]